MEVMFFEIDDDDHDDGGDGQEDANCQPPFGSQPPGNYRSPGSFEMNEPADVPKRKFDLVVRALFFYFCGLMLLIGINAAFGTEIEVKTEYVDNIIPILTLILGMALGEKGGKDL